MMIFGALDGVTIGDSSRSQKIKRGSTNVIVSKEGQRRSENREIGQLYKVMSNSSRSSKARRQRFCVVEFNVACIISRDCMAAEPATVMSCNTTRLCLIAHPER